MNKSEYQQDKGGTSNRFRYSTIQYKQNPQLQNKPLSRNISTTHQVLNQHQNPSKPSSLVYQQNKSKSNPANNSGVTKINQQDSNTKQGNPHSVLV
jgi:hypothetical protein